MSEGSGTRAALDPAALASFAETMTQPPQGRPSPPQSRSRRAQGEGSTRAEREAAALRENLRRRKQQARERAAAPAESPETRPEGDDDA